MAVHTKILNPLGSDLPDAEGNANKALVSNGTDFIAQLIANANLQAGIDAAKVGNGNVSNAVLDYIQNLSSDAQAQLNAKIATALLGAADGVAQLNSSGKLVSAQIPDSITGALVYQGTWDASNNTPTIPASDSGNKGHYYKVSVAGSTNIDGETDWKVGDYLISNGTQWDKVDNTESVVSVAGKTGIITLEEADITNLDKYTQTEIDNLLSAKANASALSDYLHKTNDDYAQSVVGQTGEVTVGQIVTALEALTSTNRLDAQSLKNLPGGFWDTTAIQSAEQTVNNSSTLTDSNDLVIALESNSKYLIDVQALLDDNNNPGGSNAGVKWTIQYSGTANNGKHYGFYISGTGTSMTVYNLTDIGSVGSVSFPYNNPEGVVLKMIASIETSTAGNLKFQFAQSAANGSDSAYLRAGSVMNVKKVA